MAETKIETAALLRAVDLVQGGKKVSVPVKDNYAVYPAKDSPLALLSGEEVLKQLRLAFPNCVFTWFAKPFVAKVADKPEDPKK